MDDPASSASVSLDLKALYKYYIIIIIIMVLAVLKSRYGRIQRSSGML